MESWITYVIIGAIALFLFIIIYNWIVIFNKFQYWINKAQRKFADIDVIMQQRIDMLPALAQAVKKYDIHEYKALKDVIEARSRWTKDTTLNEKVQSAQAIENNFFKLQAVFEKYPQLKASELHMKIMGRGNITKIEGRLRRARLEYNRVAQQYNMRVAQFPRNMVAAVHKYHKLDYLKLGNEINQGPQETFKPKELFDD